MDEQYFQNENTESALAEEVEKNLSARVLLFNDETHSFDEVIYQIIKAIKCSQNKAAEITWRVHNDGQAVVFSGDFSECLTVSAILEEIDLGTRILY